MTESTFDKLAQLPVRVVSARWSYLRVATASGWLRRTTVFELGDERGNVGLGEDVTYESELHARRRARGARAAGEIERGLAHDGSLRSFCRALDDSALVREGDFTRWALESAALDLALRAAGTNLAELLGRRYEPVRFVVSLGLGPEADATALEEVLARAPAARFKVDFGDHWTPSTVDALAATARIDVIDFKAHYRGAFTGPAASPELYALTARKLRSAWLEDPSLEGAAGEALREHAARVTFDAPLHSLADILALAAVPRCINVKPSRLGSLAELCRVLDHCVAHGIAMYSGGQFELGPGRAQIQELASLWYPDNCNDAAPPAYNARPLPDRLPASPLVPRPANGFGTTFASRRANAPQT